MKRLLTSGVLAAALAVVPLTANAGMCGSGAKNYGPGKGYMHQGYKPHPYSHRYSYPMPRHHGYHRHGYGHPGHPHHGYKTMKPYPYGKAGQGEGAAQNYGPGAASGAAAASSEDGITSDISD